MMLKAAYDWLDDNDEKMFEPVGHCDLDASMTKGFIKASIYRIFRSILIDDLIKKIWKMSKREYWDTHADQYKTWLDNVLYFNVNYAIEYTGDDDFHEEEEGWFRTFDLRDCVLCHEILSYSQPYNIHSFGGICKTISKLKIYKCYLKEGFPYDRSVKNPVIIWKYNKDKEHILPYTIDQMIEIINLQLLNDMLDNYRHEND